MSFMSVFVQFTENEDLKNLPLLQQQDILFVQASLTDRIWGASLQEEDSLIKQRSTWKGLNLMGYLLTNISYLNNA